MTMKSAILAAVIGFATITGATAAPLGAPAASTAVNVDAGTTNVGRGHGHGHGHRHHGRHRRHFRHHAYYGRDCFKKKFKVWSEYHGGWVYKYRTVCYRGYRY